MGSQYPYAQGIAMPCGACARDGAVLRCSRCRAVHYCVGPRISLGLCYAVSGTDIAYGGKHVLCVLRRIPELAYGATIRDAR
eukprot:3023431-Rhodomonas_salina.3